VTEVTERRWTARLVVAGVALTMLAAACGNSSNSPSSGGGGSSSSSGGDSVQTVSQANYSFSPSTFTVNSGDTITVKNTTSSTQHTFTITGQSVDLT
jgi:plastocyanin